jgi:hypothetical protein
MTLRKFDQHQLSQAKFLREQGEKWVVIEFLLGDGIKNAMYSSLRRLPYRCKTCDAINHRNLHFCRSCGNITDKGKLS